MTNNWTKPRFEQILIVSAIWVIEFLVVFVTKSLGVLLPVLLDQFETRTSDIGVVVSVVMFSGNVIGLTAQAFTEKFHVRPVLIACGVITSTGLLVSALANSIAVLIIGMTLIGAMTMGDAIVLGKIASYFPKQSDAVSNIVLLALPIGFIVAAPFTQLLLDVYGWRSTLIIISALYLHNIAAALYMKPSKIDNEYSTIPFNAPEKGFDAQPGGTFNILKNVLNISVLKNVSVQVVLVIGFVAGVIFNGWAVYLVSMAQSKDMLPATAANVVLFSGVGAFIMRVILAIMAVRGTFSYHRLLLLISSVLLMISFGGFSFVSSFWAFSVFSFLLGFGHGILGSQMVIAINHYVVENDRVSAMSWSHIFVSVGYLASGYVSVDDFLPNSAVRTTTTDTLNFAVSVDMIPYTEYIAASELACAKMPPAEACNFRSEVTGFLYDISGTFFMTSLMLCAVSLLIPLALAAEYVWINWNR